MSASRATGCGGPPAVFRRALLPVACSPRLVCSPSGYPLTRLGRLLRPSKPSSLSVRRFGSHAATSHCSFPLQTGLCAQGWAGELPLLPAGRPGGAEGQPRAILARTGRGRVGELSASARRRTPGNDTRSRHLRRNDWAVALLAMRSHCKPRTGGVATCAGSHRGRGAAGASRALAGAWGRGAGGRRGRLRGGSGSRPSRRRPQSSFNGARALPRRTYARYSTHPPPRAHHCRTASGNSRLLRR